MPDRETIIEDAEQAIEMLGTIEEPTWECDFIRVSFENALELLKAQEPVPPWSRIEVTPEGTSFVIDCGACKTELVRVQRGAPFNDVQENVKYCIRCGKAVKWNARQGESD